MPLRTREAAGLVGVSKNTLLRWFREGRVDDVPRDRNGWRIFSDGDVARIKNFADRTFPPAGPVTVPEVEGAAIGD